LSQSYKSASRGSVFDQSQQIAIQHPQRLSQLAMLAIVSQIFLLASAWLLPIVSEYRLIEDNISELALGRYGFIQTIAFLIAGVGTLVLAFAIRKLTLGVWGSLVGSLLIAIYGVGAILEAIFPTDRIDSPADVLSLSPTGLVHVLVALLSFLCVVAGMVILTWTFSRAARWRSLTLWFALLATSAVSLFLIQAFEQGVGPRVGLTQRVLLTAIAGWLILAAHRVRSIMAESVETSGKGS
jgi:hypothetical protein